MYYRRMYLEGLPGVAGGGVGGGQAAVGVSADAALPELVVATDLLRSLSSGKGEKRVRVK